MIVRPETPRDGGAIHRVHVAAFGDTDEADLVNALRASEAWIDGLSWVADDNGLVIAHALISRVEIDEAPALSLAPVSVLPERQRQGHGTAVIRAALDAARATGLPLVVVLGDPAYYRRLGFQPAADYHLSAPWPGVADAFQVLLLPSYAGQPQGKVSYPVPFKEM
ncbi:N-acetyltransferase [Longispora fulva]|uniref:Putative acetyltransferase n=1 Tax=Longispora fulva TaxID=619741 RepID=A0A8J7GF94_9ACTN|nr:N-acetyltransferase [Longispora fulva]MBG6135457.1 putative acetyltransferase [Longispora fulva]GIG56301.1 N-acetyltransferase [Longispora fulva]